MTTLDHYSRDNSLPALTEEGKRAFRAEIIVGLMFEANDIGHVGIDAMKWTVGYLKKMQASDLFTVGMNELQSKIDKETMGVSIHDDS
jgi:hypothetical protein